MLHGSDVDDIVNHFLLELIFAQLFLLELLDYL